MDNNTFADFFVGTGADIDVPLGWIPDYVRVVNLTDGDKIHENWLGKAVAFTSGGTTETKAGDAITGVTSGAKATVRKVLLSSGSWAGGDAAGFLILDPDSIEGTFSGENAGVNHDGVGDPDNDITLSAAPDQDGVDIDTEVAGTTTAATNIAAYTGTSAGNAKGFTIGSSISESGKLLGVVAVRTAASPISAA